MSTYTDLKNTIKETVVVNYTDRNTNQEVHFLNENNEYWGTFKGKTALVSSEIENSTLKNVKIIGAELQDAKIGPINLDEVQNLVQETSAATVTLNQQISNITGTFTTDIQNLSAAQHQHEELATEKFDTIDLTIETVKQDLSAKIDSSISSVIDQVTNKINVISTEFDDEFYVVSSEIQRVDADTITRDTILNDKIITIAQELSIDVLEASDKVDLQLANLSAATKDEIIKNRHYKFLTSEERYLLNTHFPHKLQDFTVNAFRPTIYSSYVKDPDGVTIAGVFEDTDGNTIVQTFDLAGSRIDPYLLANYQYTFNKDINTVSYAVGYQTYALQKTQAGFSITRTDKSINYIKNHANIECGNVTDSKFINNEFISGYINLFDEKFGQIIGLELNNTDKTSADVNGTIVQYLPTNILALSSGLTTIYSTPLYDDTTHYQFGLITGIEHGQYARTTTTHLSIDLIGDLSVYGSIVANNVNGTSIVDLSNDQLSVVTKFNDKTIEVVKQTKRFVYDGVIHTTTGTSKLIPVIPNTYNLSNWNDITAVNEISVDLTDVLPGQLATTYVLTSEVVAGIKQWNITHTETANDIESTVKLTIFGDELTIHVKNVVKNAFVTDGSISEYEIKCDISDIATRIIGDTLTVLYKATLDAFDFTDTETKYLNTATFTIQPVSEVIAGIREDLTIEHVSQAGIMIEMPNSILNNNTTLSTHAQEFIIAIEPGAPYTQDENDAENFVDLHFVNPRAEGQVDYCEAKIVNNDRGNVVKVPVGKWTTLSFRQIAYHQEPIYFVDDLDENKQDIELDAIQTIIAEHAAQISAIETTIENSITTEIETIEEKLADIVTTNTNHSEAINTLTEQVATISADILTLDAEINRVETTLSDSLIAEHEQLVLSVNKIEEQFVNINTSEAAIAEQLTILSTGIQINAEQLSTNSQVIATTVYNLEQLSAKHTIDTTNINNTIVATSTETLVQAKNYVDTSISTAIDAATVTTLENAKTYTNTTRDNLSSVVNAKLNTLSVYTEGSTLKLSVQTLDNSTHQVSIDTTKFLEDKFINSVYIDNNNNLVFKFNDNSDASVPLTSFVDIYTPGTGLILSGKQFSIDTSYLNDTFVTTDALSTFKTDINTSINTTITNLTSSIEATLTAFRTNVNDDINAIATDVDTFKTTVNNELTSKVSLVGDKTFATDTGLVGNVDLSGNIAIYGDIVEHDAFDVAGSTTPHKIQFTNGIFQNLSVGQFNGVTVEEIATLSTDLDADQISFGELVTAYNNLANIVKKLFGQN